MTRRRRWVRGLVITAVVIGGLFLLGKWLLTSRFAARLVADQVQARLGSPVEIGDIDVGLFGSSTLGDVQVFEPNRTDAWLRAESLTADVSLWDALWGEADPQQVQVHGLRVEVRFSDKGDLLTRFPSDPSGAGDATLPVVTLADATLILRQEGKPLFVVRSIDGVLRNGETGLNLQGTAADPAWGDWTYDADFQPATGLSALDLQTRGAQLTPERLAMIPFMPPEVLAEVTPTGPVAADVRLRFAGEPLAVRYRVALQLLGIDLGLTTVGLRTRATRGEVVIDNGRLDLRNLTGKLGSGDLAVSGVIDLAATPQCGQLALDVRRVELSDFPPSWEIPPQLTGQFSGRAQLGLLLQPRLTVTGTGTGAVENATVAGVPATGPIPLHLRSDPRGLFLSETPRLTSVAEWLTSVLRFPWLPFPTYLHARLRLDGVALAPFVRAFKIDLPVPVEGTLVSELDLAIPLNAPTDLTRYAASGRFTIRNACIEKQSLDRLSATFRLQRGVLTVADLTVAAGDKSNVLSGEVRLPLFSTGDITARLQLHDLPVAPILRQRFRDVPLEQACVTGTLHLRIPSERICELQAWTASGDIVVDPLRADKVPLDWASAQFSLAAGLLEITAFQGGWQGLRVAGQAQIALAGQRPWQAAVRLQPAELDLVRQLLPQNAGAVPLTGLFSAEATAEGTLQPPRFQADGTARLANLNGPGVSAEPIQAKWAATQETFQIHEVHCKKLELAQVPLDAVQGQVDFNGGRWAFDCAAEVHNGHVQIDGQTTAANDLEGSVRVAGVPLDRLWSALRLPGMAALKADIDVETTYRLPLAQQAATDWWKAMQAGGRVWLSRVRWDRSDVGPEVRGDFRWQNEQLELRDVTGTLAQGRLRARAMLYPEQMARSWYEVNLDRLDSARAMQMVLGTTRTGSLSVEVPPLQGPLDIRLRGTLGRTCRGTGQIVMGRGKVYGIDVTELRVPLRASFSPDGSTGQIDLRDCTAHVARGRLDIDAMLGWGLGSQVKGTLRFFQVDLPGLLKPFIRLQQLGQGRISGRIDFAGHNVKSITDLTASMDAELRQTQALEFPVLRDLAPFLPAVRTNSPFANGTLRASLSRGVVRLQPLAFEGTLLDLLVEGTVTVPQGRLALDVTAHSASLAPDPMLIRLLGVPLFGPVPTAVLVRASNYLASRILHLRVSGTFRSPHVRIEPVQMLTEEAVRFFLLRPSIPRARVTQ